MFRQENESTRTATIVLRGGTPNFLDDLERAVDDGCNVVKALAKDGRLVAGAGACELELARRLTQVGEKTPGLRQYGIKAYAEALEVIPRTLGQNAGFDVRRRSSYSFHSLFLLLFLFRNQRRSNTENICLVSSPSNVSTGNGYNLNIVCRSFRSI